MKLIVTMHVHQHCPQLCLFKKIIKLCLLLFFVQKKEKKNMEDFNRLSSKIVCYNYTCWQMNTFCVRKCTHSMVSVLILALKKKNYLKIFLWEINFNILKQRMVNLNLRNLLHACNLFFFFIKKKTKKKTKTIKFEMKYQLFKDQNCKLHYLLQRNFSKDKNSRMWETVCMIWRANMTQGENNLVYSYYKNDRD